MHYMVRRQSRSGGAEYLVPAKTGRKGYRWDKVGASDIKYFTRKATARRNAKVYDGNAFLAEFPAI
jgi:hypothetical protein